MAGPDRGGPPRAETIAESHQEIAVLRFGDQLGIFDSEWVYRNPFVPGRLSDDEITIATCLLKMAEYVEGGSSFYSLAEASQDHYLAIEMQSAISQQTTITTTTQGWAEGHKE